MTTGTQEESFTKLQQHMSFGAWLRRRRKQLDLSQAALGNCIGVSTSSIKKYEQEQRRPDRDVVRRLIEVFQIDPREHESFVGFARQRADLLNQPSANFADSTQTLPVPPASGLPPQKLSGYPNQPTEQTPVWADWPLLLYDSFDDDRHGWSVGTELKGSNMQEYGTALKEIVDGTFRLTLIPRSRLGFGWGGGIFFSVPDTYYVAVDVVQVDGHTGDSCGIMFGAVDNANYHLFSVRGFDREFLVTGVRDDDQWNGEPEIRPRYHRVIRRGSSNRLAVLAQGTLFVFYINGVRVGEATICTLPGNAVDVVVIAREHFPVTGVFANLEVRVPQRLMRTITG